MKRKKAFTLAEVLVALSVMFVIVAVMVPVLRRSTPNNSQVRLKHAYSQVIKIVETMIADVRMYPNAAGFSDTSNVTDAMTGEVFGGNSKFADLFISNLNVVNDNLWPIVRTNVPLSCPSINSNRADCTMGVSRDNTKCVKTNSGVTFCLPRNTSSFYTNRAPNAIGVIRMYFSDDYSDNSGFYIAISTVGRVSVLPANLALGINCANGNNYETVNQCRMNDMLIEAN